jgi:hypothetical protein
MRDVHRRGHMAFSWALEILIDETSYLDLKQNCLIEKKTFGWGFLCGEMCIGEEE